jgi:hypothetical protein
MCRIFKCQGCKNPGRQFVRVTKSCTVAPNFFWVIFMGLTLLAANILRQVLDFWKNCVITELTF